MMKQTITCKYVSCISNIYVVHFRNETELSDKSCSENEKSYLVYESCLHSLFDNCRHCNRPTEMTFTTIGSMLQIKVVCVHCEHDFTWNSQPYVNHTPKGNVLIAASIIFSGSTLSKVLRLFASWTVPAFLHLHSINIRESIYIKQWITFGKNSKIVCLLS